MASELVPEIHDIGKLINKKSTDIKHNFENYPGKLSGATEIRDNATWKGIKEHHCKMKEEEETLQEYPKSRETLILCLADNLASAVSRHLEIGGSPIYNVYKLWNPSVAITKLSYAISAHSMGKEWVEKIVDFVNKNPSADEYFAEFGEYLKRRCEDAHPGCNITSLYTHSVLTGKFYRVLKNIDFSLDVDFQEKDIVCNFLKNLSTKLRINIIKGKIKLPLYFHRVRDLNAVKIREEIIEKFRKYPEIFFTTSDELIIFSPNEEIIEKIRDEISRYGFILEITKKSSRLTKKEFVRFFRDVLADKGERETFYPDLENEIPSKGGLCEICQLRSIKPYEKLTENEKKIVTDEKTGIIDKLCERCLEIRKYGEPYLTLKEWTEGEVVWIRIKIDFNLLERILKSLYAEYISESPEKVEISPSVISEFLMDYHQMLEEWRKKIEEHFDAKEKRVQLITEDMFCIRIDKLNQIIQLLNIFTELIQKYFPKFKKIDDSPIKLCISSSHVKFPFFEHWRYINYPKFDINIYIAMRDKIEIKLKQLDELLSLPLENKRKLEELVLVSEKSQELAFMQIFSKDGIKNYPELQKALGKGFTLSDLLTYVKIKSD